MSANRVIGVDVGGTKILAGVVDRDGAVERHRETPTPTGSEAEFLDGLYAAVEELRDDGDRRGRVRHPVAHRPRARAHRGLGEHPARRASTCRRRMEERFGVPVGLENDANAAALAEFHAGAGRGTSTMVMLTLGTGCGGGVVLDGKLYRGWAEIGHMVIELDGVPCHGACTGRGHLEAYVSGHAATRSREAEFGPGRRRAPARPARERGQRPCPRAPGRDRPPPRRRDREPREPLRPAGRRDRRRLLGRGRVPARAGARGRAARRADAGGEQVRVVRAGLGTSAGMIGAGLVAFETLAE